MSKWLRHQRLYAMSFAVAIATLLCVIVAVPSVSAASAQACSEKSSSLLGFPTWYKYLPHTFENGSCKVDVTIPDDAGKILAAVFEILLRVGGIVAVIFVIYGGVQYVVSQGEPENIKNARTTIVNALIGLVITMFATGIVNLIAGGIK